VDERHETSLLTLWFVLGLDWGIEGVGHRDVSWPEWTGGGALAVVPARGGFCFLLYLRGETGWQVFEQTRWESITHDEVNGDILVRSLLLQTISCRSCFGSGLGT